MKTAWAAALAILLLFDWALVEAVRVEHVGLIEQCGNARCAFWKKLMHTGDCSIKDVQLIMRRDGSVSWAATVSSEAGNNSYCVVLKFLHSSFAQLWQFTKICSPTLRKQPQIWTRDNLAIPADMVPIISEVRRRDSC
jgi:hypothetical protein